MNECTCGTTLLPHCPSCTWLRCPNAECEWTTYNPARHVRVNRSGTLEAHGEQPLTDG